MTAARLNRFVITCLVLLTGLVPSTRALLLPGLMTMASSSEAMPLDQQTEETREVSEDARMRQTRRGAPGAAALGPTGAQLLGIFLYALPGHVCVASQPFRAAASELLTFRFWRRDNGIGRSLLT